MTLDELEEWLALQIVGRYHAEIHSSLQLPPISAWNDAIAARRNPLRLPHDRERFLQDFLPFEERSIRRDGVHLFGLRYWDDVLSPWAGRSARRMRVRYDPRDLSCVFVEGPDGTNWPIRFADTHLKNGFGVMFDDLLAAAYAIAVMKGIQWLV